jgi:hypothetical protein
MSGYRATPSARGTRTSLPKHEEGNFKLGRWVAYHRVLFRRGQLQSDRRERLERFPGWTWDAKTDAWEEGYDHLLQYVNREGHARIAAKHQENGFPLGGWVRRQRVAFSEGKLDAKRCERLEAVDGWTWDARRRSRGAV